MVCHSRNVLFVAEASQLANKPVPEHKSLPLCQRAPWQLSGPPTCTECLLYH